MNGYVYLALSFIAAVLIKTVMAKLTSLLVRIAVAWLLIRG